MQTSIFNRLSIIFFFYYSISGLITVFLSVYLENRGFSSVEIGEIIAIFIATKIIGPIILAKSTDLKGKPLPKIRFATLLALLSFSLLFIAQSFWLIAFSLLMFSLFWSSILPPLTVITLNSFDDGGKMYARIRLWGSLGFISTAVLGGVVLGAFSSEAFIYLGMVVLLGLFASIFIINPPVVNYNINDESTPIFASILDRNFISFFLAGLLLTISFGPYSAFFALYVQDLGYPSYSVGLFVAISVVSEIVMFIFVGPLLKRFSVGAIIVFCLLITSLRWFLLGYFAENIIILILSQVIHAASFGLYHSVSMKYLQCHFEPNQQTRGQAIYSGGVSGIGGALGAYFAGQLWLNGGGYEMAYNMATITALIGGGIAVFMLKKTN